LAALCRESHSAATFACQIFLGVDVYTKGCAMTVSERASPYDRRRDIADKPVSEACFNDWKRFCFVLREIASGENGRPLSSLEAQTRAQAVLTECGYTWPGRAQVHEPVVAPFAAPESLNAQASIDSEQSSAGTKPKSVGNAQSRPRRRRSDPPPKRASHRCYYCGSHG
jgi:hypothetical protein